MLKLQKIGKLCLLAAKAISLTNGELESAVYPSIGEIKMLWVMSTTFNMFDFARLVERIGRGILVTILILRTRSYGIKC